ncbi:hypothetical protein, partial [Streptococcus salivarius]
SHKFFLMMVWSLFIIVLMGLFVYTQKAYNLYSGFTHYRNYRAKKSFSRVDFYELEYERNNRESWKGSLWGKRKEVY